MTLHGSWAPFGAGGSEPDARLAPTHEEVRRAPRSTQLAVGTLACNRCDAPVAPGEFELSLADPLMCPFCRHQGPAREFLSLGEPTRPTRVALRVRGV